MVPPVSSPPIPATGPLTAEQSMALCAGCVRCCTYVAVEVDSPDAPWIYDQYVWLLYHKNVWMYVERGNKWFVQFETVCEKLSPVGHCTVHGKHPVLCKDYDARDCERRGDISDVTARFYDGDDLVRWMEAKRPVHYKRYRKWFDTEHAPAAYGNAPAQVRDTGAAKGGNLAKRVKSIPLVRYAMPPAPVNPLLFKSAATRVAYKKSSGPSGNGGRANGTRPRPRKPVKA